MGLPRIPRARKGHVTLRPAQPGDGPALAQVFHDAVRTGAARHYSEAERAAWSPTAERGPDWEDRLLRGHTHVALVRRCPVGFATLGSDGHLDLFYVTPAHMGCGTADRLHDAVLSTARELGLTVLSTEASHLARSFLSRRDWHTLARQSVIRRGVAITNFRMELDLPAT